jgi:serine/threonine protein kinase
MNVTLKKDKNVNKRELMLNINLPIEDSLSMNYL